ncbi:MAG: WG repeat-containing protein [Candidatus Kapaibacteriota bacterium]
MRAYIIPFLIVAALVLNANALLAQSTPNTLDYYNFDPISPTTLRYWYSGLGDTPSHILGQGRIPYRAKNGKWGYCNAEKQIIIAAEYDEVECFPSVGCAKVKKNGKWGLVDSSGKVVRPCEYTWMDDRSDNTGIRVNIGGNIDKNGYAEGGKWGVLSIMGKEILPVRYTEIHGSDTELYAKLDYRIHIYNLIGKEMIIPKFRDVYPLVNDTYIVITMDGKWGFFNRALGKTFALREIKVEDRFYLPYTPQSLLMYYSIREFGNKICLRIKDKYYLIDSIGNRIVLPEYEYVQVLSDEYATVQIDGQWGLLDHNGKEVVRPKYDDFRGTRYQNLFVVQIGQKWGFLHGKELLLRRYDYIGHLDIDDGYIDVREGDKEGLVDSTGKEIVPPRYESIFRYSGGYMCIKLNGKYGFIDRTGREVILPRYDDAFIFSEGYALVQNNGKYGFVDTTGKEVVPLRYDKVRDFSSGYALVMLNSKCSFIDHSGREVIPPRYDNMEDFSEGFSAVMLDKKCGFIDSTGKEVVSPRYDNVGCFSQGYAVVQLGNKYGFIDRTGKEVIPPRYERISGIVNGYIKVTKEHTLGDKTQYLLQGYVGIDGTEYWEGGYTAPKK